MNSWKVPHDIAAYVTSDAEAFMAYYGTREKPDRFVSLWGKDKCVAHGLLPYAGETWYIHEERKKKMSRNLKCVAAKTDFMV